MNRQYLHISVDKETAEVVGKRKKGELVIIKIKAKEAYINGIQFYEEENGIWLANQIPSKYFLF
jgi:putative RNA 2'-phosphotransferase